MNGQAPRDVIEYQLLADEADLELDVRRGRPRAAGHGRPRTAGEPLGVEVQSALFDQVRTCDNHCEFCFIYQLPKGLRPSLYLKDDDYRLSFLYGNFTTLTRFTEADLERVVTERLSPLYVSIHATDPEVRARMLRNRRGATSLRWLRALLDHGIEVHGQVVVCPGVNDGAVLDDTLAGVLDRYPRAGVAGRRAARRQPVHHRGGACARTRADEAGGGGRHWSRTGRSVFLAVARPAAGVRGRRVLPAGRPAVPGRRRLRGLPACTRTASAWPAPSSAELRRARSTPPSASQAGLLRLGRRRAGQATAYRGPRARRRDRSPCRPRTGRRRSPSSPASTAPRCWRRCWPRLGRDDVRVVPVRNGSSAATSPSPACWSARTSPRALADEPDGHRYLLPDVCLSRARFLDGTAGRPAPARRGRAHRRARRCAQALAGADDTPVVAVVGRPNVGQVDPGQPHRRPPRGDRRGAARRHPRPQGGRGRVERAAVHAGRHRRLAGDGRRPRPKVSRRPSGRSATPTSSCSWSTPPSASPRRTTGWPDLLRRAEPARAGRRQQGRRRPAGRPTSGSSLALGLGDPWPVERPARPRDRRPARRGRAPAARRPTSTTSTGRRPTSDERRGIRPWPSSAGPTWASRRCSTGSSATSASVVHDLPGTTRDTIDTVVETDDGPIRFVDTAGMRRKSRIDEGTEYYSLVRALQAIDRADVRPARHRRHRGRHRTRTSAWPSGSTPPAARSSSSSTSGSCSTPSGGPTSRGRSADRLAFLGYAPVLKVSALTGMGVHKLLPALAAGHRRLPPPGADPGAQRGDPGRPGGPPVAAAAGSSTPPRAPTDPPTFTLFTNRDAAAAPTCATSSARSGSLRLRADAAQAPGPAARPGSVGRVTEHRGSWPRHRGRLCRCAGRDLGPFAAGVCGRARYAPDRGLA